MKRMLVTIIAVLVLSPITSVWAYTCSYSEGTSFKVKEKVSKLKYKKYKENSSEVHYVKEALGCIVVLSVSKSAMSFSESTTCGDGAGERRYHGKCVK